MNKIKIFLNFIRFKQITADQYHIQRYISVRHQGALYGRWPSIRALILIDMRHLIFIFFFFITIQFVNAQQSFELRIGDQNVTEWNIHSTEYQNTYYAVGFRNVSDNTSSYINRISFEGEILQTEWYPKQDTINYLSLIFKKDNGNLLCVGNIVRNISDGYLNHLYFREITPDLDLVQEVYDSLPATNGNTSFRIKNYLISPMNEIILQGVADTAIEGYTHCPFFAKYDFNGNRISHKIFYNFIDSTEGSELFFNEDSTAFYLIGSLSLPYAYDWAKFDLDFNYLGCGNFPTNESAFTNTPLSVKRLQDGNFIMAHKLYKVGNTYVNGFEMRLYNNNFDLLDNIVIYDEDEVNIPVDNGMGFINEDHIWVSTFVALPPGIPGISGIEDIRFYVFDLNLNLKGSKVSQGDRRYWLFDLLATSDGGCLISGICDETPVSTSHDTYLQKVSLADVVTGSSEQMAVGQEVRIGPLPATDRLAIQTRNTDCTLLLRDMKGQIILQRRLNDGVNQLDIRHLPSGMYIATVSNNESKHIENFKIIKQ